MTHIQQAALRLDSAIEYLRKRDYRPGHTEVYGAIVVGRPIGDDLAIDTLLLLLASLAADYRMASRHEEYD